MAVIGLTSPGNRAFLETVGTFSQVVAYDDIETLDLAGPVAIVDFAGNANVIGRLHRRFADAIVHSAIVGVTHWEATPEQADLPGAPRALFFAPDQIRKRLAEWGGAEFGRRFTDNLADFVADSPWLKLETARGPEGLARAWAAVAGGKASPDTGLIVKL